MGLERPNVVTDNGAAFPHRLDRRDVESYGAIIEAVAPHQLSGEGH